MTSDHSKYWKAVGREKFDREHARGFINGGVLFPWCLLSWKEKVLRVFLFTFVVSPVFIACFITMMVVIGTMIEGVATHNEQLDRCKRQAESPYDYHRC